MNNELKKGDTVRVLASGKLYRVRGIDSDGPYFQQWRPGRMAYYGPSFVLLKPGRYEKVDVAWPEPQTQPTVAKRKRPPKTSPAKTKPLPPDINSQIAKIEAMVQPILDNAEFMKHLKSYPWPDMGPGIPPSMSYTAHDHLVVNFGKRIRYYTEKEDLRGYLSLLKDFLVMLRHEQIKWSYGTP